MKRTRKQVKADRLWKHWLHWLSPTPFGPDLKPIPDYNPGTYRNAFERFQTHGPKALTEAERYGIAPLIAAQKAKEVFLTSLAEESMEWWAKGWGWVHPWASTLSHRNAGTPMDRLTYAAIQRTMRSLARDPLNFFLRHPGIAPELKQRYLAYKTA